MSFFAQLHKPGEPLVLYNIWDVGTARAVAKAGAPALATSSWAVAKAIGATDGENTPLDWVVATCKRIAVATNLPLSIDFEAGYATSPSEVADNVERLIHAGAIGINFEDQIIGSGTLNSVAGQCRRIEAIRKRAGELKAELFINARTDLFLLAERSRHSELIASACERASAYASAGANGFFVPGLTDEALIQDVCGRCCLPINVMIEAGSPSLGRLTELGVARISYGGIPFATLMTALTKMASEAYTPS